MPGARYSSQEIEIMLDGFNQGIPLSGIEAKLKEMEGVNPVRDSYGIFQKMKALNKVDPDTWDTERLRDYARQYREEYRDDINGMNIRWYHEGGGKENKRQQRKKPKVKKYYRRYRRQHRDEIRTYHRQWYSESKKVEEFFPYVQNVPNLGYGIGSIALYRNRLRINIQEPKEDVDMEYAVQDFKNAIQEMDLLYPIIIEVTSQGRSVLFSPTSDVEEERQRAVIFLKAYKRVLQQ